MGDGKGGLANTLGGPPADGVVVTDDAIEFESAAIGAPIRGSRSDILRGPRTNTEQEQSRLVLDSGKKCTVIS